MRERGERMNEYRDERWCYFHPRELVVGVCALCLNERLLLVASNNQTRPYTFAPKQLLPKIFALTNLINRLDNTKQHKPEVYDTSSSSSTQQESFISIKFEENGVASWDKGKISKMSHDPKSIKNWDNGKKIKSVVEHAKPRATLRWQRRIGHLFHLMKWKRSSKVCTKVEGSGKGKYGWIRSLTKRTKE